MKALALYPVDTFFFRDGTPFATDGATQADAFGPFPPAPSTIAGALRVSLALGRGWDGRGSWPDDYKPLLGDGPDNLGTIRIKGPFLIQDQQPLFRAPAHLLGRWANTHTWAPEAYVRVGKPIECDLTPVRLPQLPALASDAEGLTAGPWLTETGLNKVLKGHLPDSSDVRFSDDLWRLEPRIGLQRDDETRTAAEGMLYSTRHVRMREGVGLGLLVEGLPDEWREPASHLCPAGGESRLGEWCAWSASWNLQPPVATLKSAEAFAVIALTPLALEREVFLGRKPLADLANAQVISACADRPLRIGGWNSLAHQPLPLRNFLPPGTVLCCRTGDSSALARVLKQFEEARFGIVSIGECTAAGFGVVTLGIWPDFEHISE